MLKTTPLVVTVGLSLTIPLAVLGDLLLGRPARTKVVIGAVLVLIAFVGVGWFDSRPEVQAEHDLFEEDMIDSVRGTQGGLRLREEEGDAPGR